MTETVKCVVCDIDLVEADQCAMTACAACAKTLGIVPLPLSTRPPTPCSRCNAMEFLRVIPREYSTERGGEANRQIASPMHATHQASSVIAKGLFNTTRRWAADVQIENGGFGMLEMFVCRGCGFVEWYIPTVREIPASPILMTEIVDYNSKMPYR